MCMISIIIMAPNVEEKKALAEKIIHILSDMEKENSNSDNKVSEEIEDLNQIKLKQNK